MSVIGPRPQLVRDMVFMTPEQRRRHTAKPGLSGLAQVNGRNAISWEDKIEWDLKYIEKVSLLSVVIELIQYFTGWGIAELDDLFGNTLGGVIGVWGGVAMGYVQMAKYVERKNG